MNTDIKIYHRCTKTPRNTEKKIIRRPRIQENNSPVIHGFLMEISATQCLCGEFHCCTGFGQSKSEVRIMNPYNVERQL